MRGAASGSLSATGTAILWIALLTMASTATTLILACSTPFAALAALAAVHMRRHDAIRLVIVAWLASQVVGFAVHDYPRDAKTIAWAFGIGAAAIGSAVGAQAALWRLAGRSTAVRLTAAFVAAFLAYNAGLAVCALGLGGIEITLDPLNLARQAFRNGAILIGLLGLHRLLLAAGLPAVGRRTEAAA